MKIMEIEIPFGFKFGDMASSKKYNVEEENWNTENPMERELANSQEEIEKKHNKVSGGQGKSNKFKVEESELQEMKTNKKQRKLKSLEEEMEK